MKRRRQKLYIIENYTIGLFKGAEPATHIYPMSRRLKDDSKPFFSRLFKWGMIAAVWCAIFGGVILLWVARDLPEIASKANFQRRPSITMLAADKSVVVRYGDYFQGHVNVKDLPEHIPHAVLAIEDRRFYYHFGVDPIGLLRAVFANVTAGGVVQGGSTVTQQLAKNLFLSPERSIERKLQEILLSLWLEAKYTKDEILSAYLNRVYYGSGAFGIEAASRVYYNRPAKDLTLYQSATLAGLLKAPSRYAPNRKDATNSDKRARLVLDAMVEAGYISEKEADRAKKNKSETTGKAGGARHYYADWIVDQIESYIGAINEDLIVQTTFEPRIQDAAEAAYAVKMEEAAQRGVSQGAVVIMRADGPVLAMIGGRDYLKSPFNRVTQAHRQPGSAFKSFVYLAALEKGITADRLVLDAPFTSGSYRPQNYDGKYRGPIPLVNALALSLNTATIRLADHVGIDSVISAARRTGISSKLEPNMSLALGSNEVTLLELTGAYATFARMGEANTPYGILEIKTAKGKTLYSRERDEPFYKGSQRFNAGAIAQLRYMLKSVVDWGTGMSARLPNATTYGKTGTSQDYKDAWFIGFTDNLVAGVWMGNDDNKSMKRITGGTLPAPLFRDVMTPSVSALHAGQLSFGPLPERGYTEAPSYNDFQQSSDDLPLDAGVGDVFNRLFSDESAPVALPSEIVEEAPVYSPPPQGDTEAPSGFQFNN